MGFKLSYLIGCASVLLFVLVASPLFAADPAPLPTTTHALAAGLTADDIVSRLERNNEQRAASLRAYEGKRSYTLTYHGFPSSREAAIEVLARYQAPDSKSFEVVSEDGSKMIQSKVFTKLLESEREAAQAEKQRETALTPENYAFTLVGSRPSPYGGCYRLRVEPRREEKFLYRGEICVNAADFAVETIDAEPAKNPSFWTKKTRIEHRYQKIGQFWLPASNQTVTSVRMGGTAVLNIVYSQYEVH
ncbi:MAG TPA: hypothetical protein VM578_00490 [Candidatus Saccharimonadales bacterium]|nr:hypothetical protein [Candidatus Saccharimonadales bacterium]